MDYDIILFDFDGTISDSGPSLVNCYRLAIDELGLPRTDDKTLESFIGPPLALTFSEYFGLEGEAVEKAVETFRRIYREIGVVNATVMYPGVPEMLRAIRAGGKRTAVATSKPEVYAKQICEEYGIDGLFDLVAGSIFDLTRNHKSAVIKYVLEQLGVEDRSRVLMVGDRKYDVEGAKLCGIDCLGVTYGYGSEEELLEAGAKYIAHSTGEAAKLILG